MKQIYVAEYARGLGGPAKVFADGPDDAKRMAYANYMYHSMPIARTPKVDEIVVSVRPEPAEGPMDGVMTQPCSQYPADSAFGGRLKEPEPAPEEPEPGA